MDKKITQRGILKEMVSSKKKSVTFDLPPIKEDPSQVPIYCNPLRKYAHSTLHPHLRNPRHPDD